MVVVSMIVAYMPGRVSANIQLPVENVSVDEVYADKGFHPITGKAVVAPKVRLAWQDPINWDPGTPGSTDPNDSAHNPNRYLVERTNTAAGKVDYLSYPFTAGSKDKKYTVGNLDPGTLYTFKVIPEHHHKNSVDDDVPIRPNLNDTLYVVTDLAVELESTDKKIAVKFTEVKATNVKYRLTYAQVDYQDGDPRSKFENSAKKYTVDINLSKVKKDPDTGMLVYELEENIEPGKPYAITVEPILDLGSKTVVYNTQPNIFSTHTTIYFEAIDEGEYIRFKWNISESFKVNAGLHELVKTQILEFVDGAEVGQVIVELPGKNGAEVKFYKIKQKLGVTLEYQLVLTYDGYADQVKSNKILFTPQQTVIEPTKPFIAEPYSKKTHDYLLEYLRDDTIIKGDVGKLLQEYRNPPHNLSAEKAVQRVLEEKYLLEYDSYDAARLVDLYGDNRVFKVDDTTKSIELPWSSFRYRDYNASSPTYGQVITDYNVLYDIWVSNDINALSTGKRIEQDLNFIPSVDAANLVKNPTDEVIGFSKSITKYYDAKTKTVKDIVPGQIYYIQIMAKKKYGRDYSYSPPAITSIYYNYQGDSYEPPTMSNPPLEVRDITKESATLRWYEEWYEIVSIKDEDPTDPNTQIQSWQHAVWVGTDKKVYKEYVSGGKQYKLLSIDDLYKLRDAVGVTEFNDNFTYRKIDLGKDPFGVSDVKYKLLRLNYKDVEKILATKRESVPTYTLDDYVRDLMLKESQKQVKLDWKDITPTKDKDEPLLLEYKQDSLQSNEVYLFLLRPYRVMANGDVLMNYYPAAAVAKTLDNDDPLDVTPVVPNLEVKGGYSDSKIKIIFDYNKDFDYKIKYGTKDDISQAKDLEWDITKEFDEGKVPSYIDNYSYEVQDLYPDTLYYFWIQATSKTSDKSSKWSSSAMGRTTDIETPLPPRGVGMGSREKLKEHDIKNPLGEDYITVEWIKDPQDKKKDDSGNAKVTKTYSYILEVANNPLFLDPIREEITDGSVGGDLNDVKVLEKNLVQVNNLIANRVYYVRMKTKVTIEIPELDKKKEKESYNYSPTVILVTSFTGDEYDGNVDPTKEILPDDDYEIIYDKDTKELHFRFRSDEKGDKNVDQRLLAELMNKNEHEYVVDIKRYKKEPIESWRITMPDTIIEGFIKQDIDLIIDTGSFVLELPPQALDVVSSEKIYNYGNKPKMEMSIDLLSKYEQKRNMPDNISEPVSSSYDLEVNVDNSMTNYNLVYTPDEFKVLLRPSSRYTYTSNEASGYVYDPEKQAWERLNSELEKSRGLVAMHTAIVGQYGLFKSESKVADQGHWSDTYRQAVSKVYNITGYEQGYTGDKKVESNAIQQLVSSLVNESKDIDLSESLDDRSIKQLQRAGILPTKQLSGSVNRYDAISMLVKTYEIMQGEPIETPGGLNNNQELSYKAGTAGFIQGETIERPNDSLTYGEMFYMLQNFLDI